MFNFVELVDGWVLARECFTLHLKQMNWFLVLSFLLAAMTEAIITNMKYNKNKRKTTNSIRRNEKEG